jgi:hypothetical protein
MRRWAELGMTRRVVLEMGMFGAQCKTCTVVLD